MNSDSYMEVIGEDLLPDMDELNLAHNRLSQQNDTPRHVAWKKNTQFVCYHTQVWTSPDVNPIGNLWAQIKSSSEIWTEVPERSLLQRSTCSGSRRLELSPFVTNSHKSTPDHIKSLINARAGWTNHYKLFQFCYSSRTHQGCCFQNELSL